MADANTVPDALRLRLQVVETGGVAGVQMVVSGPVPITLQFNADEVERFTEQWIDVVQCMREFNTPDEHGYVRLTVPDGLRVHLDGGRV